MILAAVLGSQVTKPHCDATCQNTFYGTTIEIHKSLGAQAKSLETPQKVQSLLCFLNSYAAKKIPLCTPFSAMPVEPVNVIKINKKNVFIEAELKFRN